ncbi:DUF6221 family protein [Streptomyces sp. enrichment culture]|uniref:DUF6221 family protein n=1 Tax=Streptomyces sp. enrichment culture TaxID=1795815 RepID=UPI003F553A98
MAQGIMLDMTAELITWLQEQIDADEATAADQSSEAGLPDGLTPDNPLAALYAPARTIAMKRDLLAAWLDPDLADPGDHDALHRDWAVRVLALTSYSDRPGYRAEWAPDDE